MARAYDIIGDIHGHGDQLHALLQKLGYHLRYGCFRHPERRAIFVGDLIDRGTQNRMVLQTVMAMVAEGTALAVLGNHELNALAFHHEYADYQWLRPRSNKNLRQHVTFLYEYLRRDRETELDAALEFFMQLPLWLELDGLRVIHACWHDHYIGTLRPRLTADNCLDEKLLVEATTPGREVFDYLETLLKGQEVALPEGLEFSDKDGIVRPRMRTRWWLNGRVSYRDAAFTPTDQARRLPDKPLPADTATGYPADAAPVFFGHYWLTGRPAPLAHNVACVDYSVARGGKLAAYRFDGERALDAGKFVTVDA